MKIDNSVVVMNSTRSYESYEHTESIMYNGVAGDSKEGLWVSSKQVSAQGAVADTEAAVLDLQKNNERAKKQAEKERYLSQLQTMAERAKQNKSESVDLSMDKDGKLQMLRKLLAALRGKGRISPEDLFEEDDKEVLDMRSGIFKLSESFSSVSAKSFSLGITTGTSGSGTMWQRVSATSTFFAETESTTFASQGLVRTTDGREIGFNIELSMSRGFASQIDVVSKQNYIFTDPLVINLDTNATSVSDVKIGFDLDSDGREEQISFAGEGSGFLALDKNNDGKINDGSELFGTQSGDGFADLAEFDEDGNGWIDENDSIYNSLKIWTKDAEGNDHLDTLKSMDVGAIYLGNVNSEFSLNNDDNATNAVVRKTGIYLKESGGAGTVNHIDLAT